MADDVQRLLDSCDISDPAGVRDYANSCWSQAWGPRSIKAARLQEWTTSTGAGLRCANAPGFVDHGLLSSDELVRPHQGLRRPAQRRPP